MVGIRELNTLLRKMKPKLVEGEYAISCVTESKEAELNSSVLMTYREDEGTTVILDRKTADKNYLHYDGTWALITLTVHSDLLAIGFLAVVTNRLAEENISVNVVSAFYHDHLFVPYEKAQLALEALEQLTELAKLE